MPLPDITYFLYVREKLAASGERSLSVSKFIEQDTKIIFNRNDYKEVQKSINQYQQQENDLLEYIKKENDVKSVNEIINEFPKLTTNLSAILYIKNKYHEAAMVRQKYIDNYISNIFFWMIIDESFCIKRANLQKKYEDTKDQTLAWELDEANIKFLIYFKKQLDLYIGKNKDKITTLFGLCASMNTTSMIAEEVLIKKITLAMPAASPIWALMLISIAFNLILDKWLFNILERNVSPKFLLLNYRENIKFLILCICAAVLISFGYYVIPIVFLLFTASYFINYALQLNRLADTIEKLFFTLDENGIPHLFEGFKKYNGTTLSNTHLKLLMIGSFVSIFYVIAVIGIFATWVFPILPVVGGFAIGTILVSIILAYYVISYGLLAIRGWADLMHLDAWAKIEFGSLGIFSPLAVKYFFKKMIKGFVKYWTEAGVGFIDFLRDLSIIFCMYEVFFSGEKNKTKTQAAKDVLGAVICAIAELGLLCLKLAQIALSILVLPATYNTISIGGDKVGEYLGEEVGEIVTNGGFTANTPFALQNALKVALPENSDLNENTQNNKLSFWDKISEWRMRIFCQLPNATVNAILANDAQVPQPIQDIEELNVFHKDFFSNSYARAGGGFAASSTAGEYAIKNVQDENKKQQEACKVLLTQWPNTINPIHQDSSIKVQNAWRFCL